MFKKLPKNFTVSADHLSEAVTQYFRSLSIIDDDQFTDVMNVSWDNKTKMWGVHTYLCKVPNEPKQLELPLGDPLAR